MERHDETRSLDGATRDTLALVLAGGRGTRLHELCERRAKPALYFGGKFRIIDFALSNCVNSGILRIGVLTQYRAHSVGRHLMRGWSDFRTDRGGFLATLPASRQAPDRRYAGTADAVWQNRDTVRAIHPRHVLVLAADHVYKMDYRAMIAAHVRAGAELTVGCVEVPRNEARRFGVMAVDGSGRVVGFDEKPADPRSIPGRPAAALASMGIYVFDTDFLLDALARDTARGESSHDFGHDLLPLLIARGKVHAYAFRDPVTGGQGYWRDVGTIDAFWQANLELVGAEPELDLHDRSWPILTYQRQLPPARFVGNGESGRGVTVDSLVSSGCIVSAAKLTRSLLFSEARVADRAEVTESVLLPGAEVGRGCRLTKVVVDGGCRIPEGTVIGRYHDDDRRQGFRVTDAGVVLVTRKMLGQVQRPMRKRGVPWRSPAYAPVLGHVGG